LGVLSRAAFLCPVVTLPFLHPFFYPTRSSVPLCNGLPWRAPRPPSPLPLRSALFPSFSGVRDLFFPLCETFLFSNSFSQSSERSDEVFWLFRGGFLDFPCRTLVSPPSAFGRRFCRAPVFSLPTFHSEGKLLGQRHSVLSGWQMPPLFFPLRTPILHGLSRPFDFPVSL